MAAERPPDEPQPEDPSPGEPPVEEPVEAPPVEELPSDELSLYELGPDDGILGQDALGEPIEEIEPKDAEAETQPLRRDERPPADS